MATGTNAIALETEAKSNFGQNLASLPAAIANKCCTKARADAFGCIVASGYTDNQLVKYSSLSKLVVEYPVYRTVTLNVDLNLMIDNVSSLTFYLRFATAYGYTYKTATLSNLFGSNSISTSVAYKSGNNYITYIGLTNLVINLSSSLSGLTSSWAITTASPLSYNSSGTITYPPTLNYDWGAAQGGLTLFSNSIGTTNTSFDMGIYGEMR